MVTNIYKKVSVKTHLPPTDVNSSCAHNKYKLIREDCQKTPRTMASKWELAKSSTTKNVNI